VTYRQLSLTQPDASISDLETISDTLAAAIRDNDSISQNDIDEAFERGGVLAQIVPSKVERAKQDLAVKGMREQAARRGAMMEIYAETRLEIARKQADTLIASVGISLQNSLATFAAEQILQLNATITEMRNRFMESYGPAADQI
jgi:hypothetical protein